MFEFSDEAPLLSNLPMDVTAEMVITDGIDIESTTCQLRVDDKIYFSSGVPVDNGKCAEFSEWIDMDGDMVIIRVQSIKNLSQVSACVVLA